MPGASLTRRPCRTRTMRVIEIAVKALFIAAFVALGSAIVRNITDALTLAVGHVPPGLTVHDAATHDPATAWRRTAADIVYKTF